MKIIVTSLLNGGEIVLQKVTKQDLTFKEVRELYFAESGAELADFTNEDFTDVLDDAQIIPDQALIFGLRVYVNEYTIEE